MRYVLLRDTSSEDINYILVFNNGICKLESIQNDIYRLTNEYETSNEMEIEYSCQTEYVLGKLHELYSFEEIQIDEWEDMLWY